MTLNEPRATGGNNDNGGSGKTQIVYHNPSGTDETNGVETMILRDIKVHEDFYYNGKLWRKIARHVACGIGPDNYGKSLTILSCTEVQAAGSKA